MRIIAGEHRGRKLLPPEADVTRPITDRAKQSLFDVLSPRIEGAVVYDLFAGTGSMGLESLSRGAERAFFFEGDRSALARLRKNIEALRLGSRSQVIGGDLFKWFAAPLLADVPKASMVFLDPPYRFLVEQADRLTALAHHLRPRMVEQAVMIFRHDAADRLALPGFEPIDQRQYGGMMLQLLRASA